VPVNERSCRARASMIFERAKRAALIRFAETSKARIFALSQRHSESDGAGKAVRSLIKREFAASRRGRFVRRESARGGCTSLLNRRKELHQAVLNFLSLKSRTTSVHRSQKPRTSDDAVSTRRPCFSPVNLSGISHLLASHLRITNYRRARSQDSVVSTAPLLPSPLPPHPPHPPRVYSFSSSQAALYAA